MTLLFDVFDWCPICKDLMTYGPKSVYSAWPMLKKATINICYILKTQKPELCDTQSENAPSLRIAVSYLFTYGRRYPGTR